MVTRVELLLPALALSTIFLNLVEVRNRIENSQPILQSSLFEIYHPQLRINSNITSNPNREFVVFPTNATESRPFGSDELIEIYCRTQHQDSRSSLHSNGREG